MIKLQKTKKGQYYFTICAKNGKVLATSEVYLEKRKAIDGINSLATNVTDLALSVEEYVPVPFKDLTGE